MSRGCQAAPAAYITVSDFDELFDNDAGAVQIMAVMAENTGDIILGRGQQRRIVQVQDRLEVGQLDHVHLVQFFMHDALVQDALDLEAQGLQFFVGMTGIEAVITDDVGSGLEPHIAGLDDS